MMSAVKKPSKRRIPNFFLNVIAVIVTIFPLASLGYFVASSSDVGPRPTGGLHVIPESETPRLFKEPLVSVTFDDGWQSMYTKAAPILERYGIRSTQYVVPGVFSERNYLSVDQVRALKDAGHEIGGHSMTHHILAGASDDRLEYEIGGSKRALEAYGLIGDHPSFAAPESEMDGNADDYLYDYYASHRNTFGDIQNGVTDDDVNTSARPFNRFDIIGYAINRKTTIEQLTEALRYAAAHDGWLVLVYHQVDDSGAYYSATPGELREHMRLVASSGIKTATISHVLSNQTEDPYE